MTTIGDLAPNMVGKQRVRTTYEETDIEGLLTGLDVSTEHTSVRSMGGTTIRREYRACATPTIGSITLEDARLDHPITLIGR